MVIEWFPYHSMNFVRPRKLFPSQIFSFHLANSMLEEGRLVATRRCAIRQNKFTIQSALRLYQSWKRSELLPDHRRANDQPPTLPTS